MGKVTMTMEEVKSFMAEPWLTHVATLTKTGHPHVTPIWSCYDGEFFYITLMDGNPKSRALDRDNRISLSVSSDTLPFRGVVVHGTAEMIRGDVRPIVRKIAAKHVGDEKADGAADMLLANPQAVAKITPKRIYSWDQSKVSDFSEVAAAEKTGKDLRTL